MTTTVNIAEAKAKLSALADRAAAGEEIVLAKAGKPWARIVPLEKPPPRQPGAWRHLLTKDHDISLEALEPDEEDLVAAEGDLEEYCAPKPETEGR